MQKRHRSKSSCSKVWVPDSGVQSPQVIQVGDALMREAPTVPTLRHGERAELLALLKVPLLSLRYLPVAGIRFKESLEETVSR